MCLIRLSYRGRLSANNCVRTISTIRSVGFVVDREPEAIAVSEYLGRDRVELWGCTRPA